jgi:hypothetical protein
LVLKPSRIPSQECSEYVETIGRRRTGANGGQTASADSVRQGGNLHQTLWVGTNWHNEEGKRMQVLKAVIKQFKGSRRYRKWWAWLHAFLPSTTQPQFVQMYKDALHHGCLLFISSWRTLLYDLFQNKVLCLVLNQRKFLVYYQGLISISR